ALATPPSERTRARPPVVSSLHEELRALCTRARGRDVVVIDVDSPVIWACASVIGRPRARVDSLLRDVSEAKELGPEEVPQESGPLQDVSAPSPAESSPMPSDSGDDDVFEPELTRRAIAAIRRLPAQGQLHKGRHLRHAQQSNDFYLVLSFSGI